MASNIDKGAYAAPKGLEALADELDMPEIEIEIEDPESVNIAMDGLEIEIEPKDEEDDDFNENLAEIMDEGALASISTDLLGDFQADTDSRKDWLDTYVDGIELLGLKVEEQTEPWPGACNVYHPLLAEALVKFQSELLEYLGFDSPVEVNYEDVCEEYGGVSILEDEHESRMWKEKGSVISLQNFPRRTNPFWNMLGQGNGIFNKVDVILYGQETFGSAERSCNVNEMREMFYTIEDGKYSEKLFELFSKERVEEELEEFLKHNFIPRVGCGIGFSRLLRAYKLLKNK